MTIAPWRWASSATAAGSGVSVKPAIVKFDGWTRRTTRARALGEGRLEVRGARAVGRPDLDQPGARAADDLGDAHAAADLDQLAARHDHAPAPPGEADRERDGGGVVVGDQRVLGPGQGDEVVLGDPSSGATPAGRAVQLEQEVRAGCGRRGLDGDAAARAPGRGSCGR